MFGVGIGSARFTEPEMIARQHDARAGRVFRTGVGSPGGVALFGLEPTNQIPHGSTNGMGARGGVERCQVQTAHAGLSGLGL
jgi:hypothetical protein